GPELKSTASSQIYLNLPIAETISYSQRYKLVITVQDDGEEIEFVLFNSKVTPLLGITVEELFNKTITEGAGDPDWIVDYLINHLCTQWVVLQIKIDKYNIAPTYVRRYTTTKYYGHDVNDINKHIGISSSSESVQKIMCLDLSISSPDSYWDTTDYAIHDENLGSTISDVNDPNKGELIVDAKHVVVETHLNDFTHDESSSLPELASDVKKICVSSFKSYNRTG
ncbi:nucleic acid-binding, OB-fold protein, partial [Tanacetum coccineum]